MPKQTDAVTMRVRVGDNELEVTGPKDFVETKVEEFLKKQKGLPAKAHPPGLPGLAPEHESPPSRKKLAIAQFFKKASPKSDVDRTLVAGYYLEKYTDAENFTSADIRGTIHDARITPPKNPSDTISKNIKKGFMMPAGDKDGKRAFVLTTDGEQAVLEAIEQT